MRGRLFLKFYRKKVFKMKQNALFVFARRKEKSQEKVAIQRPIYRIRLIENGVTTQNINLHMQRHKKLTFTYSLCFIEDEQGPKQVGGGRGRHIEPHIMPVVQHESDPAGQEVTGKCFLSYVITILSQKNSNCISQN